MHMGSYQHVYYGVTYEPMAPKPSVKLVFFTYGCRRRNPVRGIGSLEALVQAVLEAGFRPKTTAILCDVGIQEVTQKIENMG